jgi:hypothetical protein
VENIQNKAPRLCWQKDQISAAPSRQASFGVKQIRGLEKSQPIKFWDSQSQCPCGNLTTETNITRVRVRWSNLRAPGRKTAKNTQTLVALSNPATVAQLNKVNFKTKTLSPH